MWILFLLRCRTPVNNIWRSSYERCRPKTLVKFSSAYCLYMARDFSIGKKSYKCFHLVYELQKLLTVPSASAEMTLPKADNDLFIFFASSKTVPSAPVLLTYKKLWTTKNFFDGKFFTFSLPAKSTKYNFPDNFFWVSAFSCLTFIKKTLWLLELCSFISAKNILRLTVADAQARQELTCNGDVSIGFAFFDRIHNFFGTRNKPFRTSLGQKICRNSFETVKNFSIS